MSGKKRVGGLKFKNIEAALLTEEQALTTIHVAVTKQLRRLEVEEQLLQEMLKRAEQEDAEQRRQQQGTDGVEQRQQLAARPTRNDVQQCSDTQESGGDGISG